jgi:hypothetical protein
MANFTEAQKQGLQWLQELGIKLPAKILALASISGQPDDDGAAPLAENTGGPGDGGTGDGSGDGSGGGSGGGDKPKKPSAREIREKNRQVQQDAKRKKAGESPARDLDPDEGPVGHPEVDEPKITLDEALSAAGITMEEEERAAFGEWVKKRNKETSHGDHYVKTKSSLGKLKTDVGTFRAERKSGGKGGGSPPPAAGGKPPVTEPGGTTPPKAGGDAAKKPAEPAGGGAAKKPAEPATPHFDPKPAEKFVQEAEALHKLTKDPKLDVASAEQRSAALEAEAETLAAELRASPELAGITGSTAREFFTGVRGKFGSFRGASGNIVVIALNVAVAYELLKDIGSILKSKTLKEGLEKTFQLGKGLVKGQIVFGALRFVFRSTPIAVGITVFLGDMDMNLGLGPNGVFDREIANLVNKVSPGAVEPAMHHDNVTNYKDPDAKKLFQETRAEAIKQLKELIAADTTQLGYDDGLTGTKARAKFEISDLESKVLGITASWLGQQYGMGFGKGDGEKAAAVKRAYQAGLDTGKAGKGANFLALMSWPELEAVRQRSFDKDLDADFDLNRVTGEYEAAYKKGYTEGSSSNDTKTLEKFQIRTRDIKGEKYGRAPLIADLFYSNGTESSVSEEVEFTIDNAAVAYSLYDYGSKVTFVHFIGAGAAKIHAKFKSGGKVFEDSTSLTVSKPVIMITPDNVGEEIGFRMQFTAKVNHFPLPPGAVTWSAAPHGIIDIDKDGNAVMLKAGVAVVTATETGKNPEKATTKITVMAKRKEA